MKNCKLFFFAALSAALNCFCNADFITKKVQQDSSLLYTYYDESKGLNESSEVCSLVLKSGSEVNSYDVSSVSLVVPNDVSYIRSLLFNVINSYKGVSFSVYLPGDLGSCFRDTNMGILDGCVNDICKSLGFKEDVCVGNGKVSRRDVFLAKTSKNNSHRYVISRELKMFKNKVNLKIKLKENIPVVEIRNI